jgi:hypothetical protein
VYDEKRIRVGAWHRTVVQASAAEQRFKSSSGFDPGADGDRPDLLNSRAPTLGVVRLLRVISSCAVLKRHARLLLQPRAERFGDIRSRYRSFSLRAELVQAMKLWAVRRQHEQSAMVELLDRLMEFEGRFAGESLIDSELNQLFSLAVL